MIIRYETITVADTCGRTNSSFENTNSSFENTNSSFENTNSSFENTNSRAKFSVKFAG